ncbi:MAG: hypothetical protein KA764_01430 [Anaerolineales bacterium]|nr:hypothetical protein [Anaerolineales bacterium]
MTFPLLPDYQLFLLPARTAEEAAAWGAAALAYAAFFPDIHFARDPRRVDWRGYSHVTIVNPGFWPEDLLPLIKQANPRIGLDLIPVTAPEILQTLLNTRIYAGLRYGPQRDVDWLTLWPAGRCLIGLHGRSDGELQPADLAVMAAARLEAVKLTSYATAESVRGLRALNPEMFILVRAFLPFGEGRTVTPAQFFEFTAADVARLYDADPAVRYIEIHNEPNLRLEGWGGSWRDGREFADWFLAVRELYQARFPDAKLGFPGLSPGPALEAGGRADSEQFLGEASAAASAADWIGVHAYWVNEREITDDRDGFGFTRYRQRFPEALLFITEFGNPQQPKPMVAQQYARYYGALRRYPGLGAAFAYVVSTSNAEESPRWAWRDEAGQDSGLAAVVGRREFVDQP